MRCSQSINSSGGYLDFGVAGGDLSTYHDPEPTAPATQSAIGYARIIIPLGTPPKRLDCSRLYDLEIQRLKAEIEHAQGRPAVMPAVATQGRQSVIDCTP